MQNYDVVVIGGGTMGSATAHQLALRGMRTLLLEQFQIVHDFGSHSGKTRIIRHAYHEAPEYVPLVRRSHELWREMEEKTGHRLLTLTGALISGPAEGMLMRGALEACRMFELKHEQMRSHSAMKRWKQFALDPRWDCVFDESAGYLHVDACIRTMAELASAAGAQIHEGERVLRHMDEGTGFRVITDRAEYSAGRIAFCAGAWTSSILGHLSMPLTVKRRVVAWLRPHNPAEFAPEVFPVFLTELPNGIFYGFPFDEPGVKVANHHSAGGSVDPETVDREFRHSDAKEIREFVQAHIPSLSDCTMEGKICLYTLTPDEHFIIDLHPANKCLAIAAGFSGHGFKFAPVVGEILADLLESGSTAHLIEKFRMSRAMSGEQ